MSNPRPPPGPPPSALKGPRPPSSPHPDQEQTFFEVKHTNSGLLQAENSYNYDADEEVPKGLINKIRYKYNKKIHEKKFTQRALVCALAVSLLWASSLGACRLIVKGFIPSPEFEDVEDALVTLATTIDEESSNYVSCVDVAFTLCTNTYLNERDAESLRVEALQDINFGNLSNFQTIRDTCAQTHDQLMNIIDALRTSGSTANFVPLIVASYNNVGNPPECLDLDTLSLNQLKAAAATDIAKANANASRSAMDNFTDQLNERIQYDLEYLGLTLPDLFVDKNLELRGPNLPSADDFFAEFNASFDLFGACTTGRGEQNGVLCGVPNTLVLDNMESILADFETDYNTLKNRANAMVNEIEGYADTFTSVVAQAGNILDSIGISNEGVVFSGSLGSPPWTFPEIDTFDLTTEFGKQNYLASLGIDKDAIAQKIQEQQDALAAAMAEAGADLTAIDIEMAQLQLDFNAKLLDDYNPPPLTYNETNEEQEANQANIADRIAAELGFVPVESEQPGRVDRVISIANKSAANFLQTVKERDFEFFQYPGSFFTDFKIGINDVQSYALLFDILYRCLQSGLLIRKYWSISGINTPPADARSQDIAIYQQKKSIFQMAAYVVTHPIVQLLQTIIWVLLITTVLYVAYEPLYTEYQNGCILNDADDISVLGLDDGTMLYRNGLSTTGNAAYKDGDKRITESISKLNLEREFSCRDNFENSVDQRDLQANAYDSFNNDQTLLKTRFDLFDTCVDWEQIDTDYDVIVDFGVNLADLVNTPACRQTFPSIDLSDDLLHNCANIAPCVHGCTGIDPETLRATNHRAGCVSEWALHAYLLSSVFSVAIYIMLNVSRLYFMRGVVAIWWKQISIDRYSYLASCTRLGTLLYPKSVTEEGRIFRDVIKEKLDIALRNFSFYGYFELAFAIALNMPWLIFLIIFGRNLEYTA
uniref:Uncharacterized protein n=1 Tax=Aplanochytrium stocchinoi TaxID=215587 RepID=A0A7S3PQT7_9STRA|mmetsp:Transcript_35265/g.43534  ORF Transcript_35265/g.43534 Transcript_35265/m.43534 type:complete len:936 (-) Transcript_35265:2119-4926(-)